MDWKHVTVLGILLTTSWSKAWSPGIASPVPMTDLTVDTTNRNDVISFYQHVFKASENYASVINWTGNHTTCSAGTLPQAYVDLMRRRVNYYRAMAGVTANITMNTNSTVVTASDPSGASSTTTKTVAAQQSAMLLSNSALLTHTPSPGMSCYSAAGHNGSFFGNVGLAVYGPPVLEAYMREDADNAAAGHRRWLLFTRATNFATGDVPRVGNSFAANCLYIRQRDDELVAGQIKFVAWPPAGYLPWRNSTEYWSLSYPSADFTNATISVTKNGVAETVDSINRTQGLGNNGIVWRVPGVAKSGVDTTYQVTVSNIGGSGIPSSHTYNIILFNSENLLEAPALTGASTVPPGGSGNYTVTPVSIAEEYRLEVTKTIPLPTTTVEGGEDATSAFIIPGPVTGYTIRASTYVKFGSKALNLAFTEPSQSEQWIELDRTLMPKASASISYYRRIGYMSSNTEFVVQYCLNNDGQWKDIPGTEKFGNSPLASSTTVTESDYHAKLTFSLPSETLNTPTNVRFLIRKAEGSEFLAEAGTPNVSGAFIDDVSFTNVDWLSARTFKTYPANATTVTLNAETAGGAITNGTKYNLRLQPRVASAWMTASTLQTITSAVVANAVPTLNTISSPLAILEDAGAQTIPLTGISAGFGETQTLTVTATSSNISLIPHPTITYTSPNTTGSLHLQPALNQSGSATITVTVNDGQPTTNTFSRTFTVNVTAVNDAPTISVIADRTINEDTNTGAIAFTIGDVETAAGSLTITRASLNTTLLPLANAVLGGTGANRTILLTPALNQFGTATVEIMVSDGTTSTKRSFVLTVLPINDAPTLATIANRSAILEDATMQTVALTGIGAGPSESQTLTITATSSNPSIIPHPSVVYTSPSASGSIQYTPVANANGSVTITVTVNDGQASNNTISRSFTAAVTAVNDAPTISSFTPRIMVQNTTLPTINFTVGDMETAATSLTVTGASNNTTKIPNNKIVLGGSGANRTVTITPAANQTTTGTPVTVTLTVSDGNKTKTSSLIAITINSQNSAPTITSISTQTINEDSATAAIPFTIGDPEELNGLLTVSAISSNTTLLPPSGISLAGSGLNRTIALTPAANQFGSATVTITVNDGQSINATATTTFTLQVNSVNDPPSISPIGNVSIDQNTSTGEISFTVGDIDHNPNSLTISASSTNLILTPPAAISLTGTGSNRKISINPPNGIAGQSTISVTVNDGALTNTSTFVLTVIAPAIVGFDAWVQNTYPQLVGSAFNDDFDKDGIPNGVEYAFSLDPTTSSKLGDLGLNQLAHTMSLVMPLPAVRDNIIYSAEYSDNLQTWSTNDMVISIAGGQITATCPMGVNRRNMRWKIIKN
jgi:imidazole glycerol phosphate synthase subunit HisF